MDLYNCRCLVFSRFKPNLFIKADFDSLGASGRMAGDIAAKLRATPTTTVDRRNVMLYEGHIEMLRRVLRFSKGTTG